MQILLTVEQEAQQIVNATNSAKMARLKQAKEEAEKEVAEYLAQMELEFQRKVTESNGDSGADVNRLEQDTGVKIQHLEKISHDVNLMLLKHVCYYCESLGFLNLDG
ncbi:V-type proton ATPase subunit G-like isoform X1 [Camellia sinensis]|uniref:V-type proton ATPase subunit G-like isoform X1 n=1 Tax=Camellia sinensis TaxID=4442 RepID=UPI001035579F|nr:V-type proton ATPase subunit G-like isoform X1 [Camellia sinensis]XP_028120120.1 V-type proton ATPase subunit G-like isoform X1 [Camellia sinensis]